MKRLKAIKFSLIFLLLTAGLLPTTSYADEGVIVLMTSKCFIIDTDMGYVIVDGWVSAIEGDIVLADDFNTYGPIEIYDINNQDISGYIYIEDWGLSKSGLQNKWDDKYRDKCT